MKTKVYTRMEGDSPSMKELFVETELIGRDTRKLLRGEDSQKTHMYIVYLETKDGKIHTGLRKIVETTEVYQSENGWEYAERREDYITFRLGDNESIKLLRDKLEKYGFQYSQYT